MNSSVPLLFAAPISPIPPSLTNRLTFAILGFENETGEPADNYVRYVIEELIGHSLNEIKTIRDLPAADYALHQINKKKR